MIHHPLDFDDIIILLNITKTKSLTKTSEELQIAIGNIRKRVAKMEAVLGQAIYTRKSTGIELTKAGNELQSLYADFYSSFENLKANYQSLGQDAKQAITISTTQGIASTILVPCIMEFIELYPNYNPSIMVYVSERELLESYSDVIIWPKINANKYRFDLKVEHLVTFDFGLFASQSYVEKHDPNDPNTEHTVVRFFDYTTTPFAESSNELYSRIPGLKIGREIKVNSNPSMYAFIKEGAGIGPVWKNSPYLENDKLIQLFQDFKTETETYIVTKKDIASYHPSKIFVDYLREYFKRILR